MILITKVEITGFRSLLSVELPNLGNLVSFVGKNSGGKSNVLRALNLFFNDEVQPGEKLTFSRDLFEQPRHRKKKRISITVHFDLPPTFALRKKLDQLNALGKQFSITRHWELDNQLNLVTRYAINAPGAPSSAPDELVRQFLSLVNYRYIPNRTVPTDILRYESQALAASVFKRMKDQAKADALMEELTAAASRMLKDASQSMQKIGSPLQDPTVSTSSLSQMLSMAGFQARGDHGGSVRDAEWGAGHQAFFLYHVLHTLDTDYSRFFGWRQATIWAVEEPESALHRDLETGLASQLRVWSQDERSRLQIILTTHSPIFTMSADAGYWVTIENTSTRIHPMNIQRLTKAAETEGVTSWTHPILSHPWNPVILVEGPDDAEALSYVATTAGYDNFRFVSLPSLDPTESGGGKDAIIGYLKRYQPLLANRQPTAPFIVLFDWDVSTVELEKARKAYGPTGDEKVIKMNYVHCDVLMGVDFKGIERFFPPRIVRDAHTAQELVLGIADGKPHSISKTQFEPAKGALLRRYVRVNDPKELIHLVKVLQDVERAVKLGLAPKRTLFDGL